MSYLECFLVWAFAVLAVGCSATLLVAVVVDLTGWWDRPNDR